MPCSAWPTRPPTITNRCCSSTACARSANSGPPSSATSISSSPQTSPPTSPAAVSIARQQPPAHATSCRWSPTRCTRKTCCWTTWSSAARTAVSRCCDHWNNAWRNCAPRRRQPCSRRCPSAQTPSPQPFARHWPASRCHCRSAASSMNCSSSRSWARSTPCIARSTRN
ncbi:hypothetical protein D3C78_1016780 [compost metagenome]